MHPLIKGTYYLRESVSPDGHEINNTITKVIVDDSGVYVDAGKGRRRCAQHERPGFADCFPGAVWLSRLHRQHAYDIKGKLQSAAVDANGNLTWGQAVHRPRRDAFSCGQLDAYAL